MKPVVAGNWKMHMGPTETAAFFDAFDTTGGTGRSSTRLADLLLTAAWSYAAGPWSIKPSVAYSVLLDEAVRDARPYDDNWILGLSVGLDL